MSATSPVPQATQEQRLKITGMTCASCVARVEKSLRKVAGVNDVSVNLATEQASITASTDVSTTDLVAAIQQAGYDVAVQEINLGIQGMTCASCVGRLEKALGKVPGCARYR
jgi:Cation transport ATPase